MAAQTRTTQPRTSLRTIVGQSFHAMTPVERRRTLWMYGSILFLHALGFFVFIAYVLPAHYKFFGIGLSITAYTLGLRHAFDADHISAIDNTTRKSMNDRQGPTSPARSPTVTSSPSATPPSCSRSGSPSSSRPRPSCRR